MKPIGTRPAIKQLLAGNQVYPLFIAAMVVLWLTNSKFGTLINLRGTLTTASTDLLVVSGLTFVLICGEIDLTVGSVVSLGSMIAVSAQGALGVYVSSTLAVVAGAAIGAVNGLLVARLRVPSILVTLGGLIAVDGIAQSVAGGQNVSAAQLGPSLAIQADVGGLLTPSSMIAVVAVLLLQVALWQTPWGRALYVIGGSDDKGRLSGLPTNRLLFGAFVISGAMAALGGVVLGIGLDTGSPTFGDNTLFLVIAAAVIGGTSIYGAEGSVAKSAIGVLLLAAISDGMTEANVATWVQNIVNGGILVLVLLLDSYFRRRRRRRFRLRTIDRAGLQSTGTTEAPPALAVLGDGSSGG